MKLKSVLGVMFGFVFCFSLVGCSQQPKTSGSKEAIDIAKTMEDVQSQVKYLVKEANAFISSEKYQDAINTAQFILSKLDKDSLEAKSIIEKAQARLKEIAEQKVQEVTGDLKSKMGTLGQ